MIDIRDNNIICLSECNAESRLGQTKLILNVKNIKLLEPIGYAIKQSASIHGHRQRRHTQLHIRHIQQAQTTGFQGGTGGQHVVHQ